MNLNETISDFNILFRHMLNVIEACFYYSIVEASSINITFLSYEERINSVFVFVFLIKVICIC